MWPLLWGALVASPSSASPAARPGSIEGVVTGLPSGLGLPNVCVTLRSATAPWLETRTTAPDGSFRFADLPSGLYSIEAKGAGWLDNSVSPVVVVPGVPVSEHLQLVQAAGPVPRS
ncbi:MAG: carboxypeptidase-like regulatory domain-containing protein [Myxococcota bacterium]